MAQVLATVMASYHTPNSTTTSSVFGTEFRRRMPLETQPTPLEFLWNTHLESEEESDSSIDLLPLECIFENPFIVAKFYRQNRDQAIEITGFTPLEVDDLSNEQVDVYLLAHKINITILDTFKAYLQESIEDRGAERNARSSDLLMMHLDALISKLQANKTVGTKKMEDIPNRLMNAASILKRHIYWIQNAFKNMSAPSTQALYVAQSAYTFALGVLEGNGLKVYAKRLNKGGMGQIQRAELVPKTPDSLTSTCAGRVFAVYALKSNIPHAYVVPMCHEAAIAAAIPPHPNILVPVMLLPKQNKLVLPMMAQSVSDFLRRSSKDHSSKPILASQLHTWVQALLAGVSHLHMYNILHLDIKPSNLLLDIDGTLKIADFGLSKFYREGDSSRTSPGATEYSAPEFYSEDEEITVKADMWSIGITIWKMYTGQDFMEEITKIPALKPSRRSYRKQIDLYLMKFHFNPSLCQPVIEALIDKIGSKKHPFLCSDSDDISPKFIENLKTILKRLLQIKPENRISIEKLLDLEIS